MKFRTLLIRILIGLGIVVLLLVLGVAGVIGYDSAFPSQQVTDFTNVSFSDPEGRTMNAYLAIPRGEGPFPAVLLIHEFFGLNQEIVEKAGLLAKEGYLVMAMDAYRGKTTALIPRAIWLVVSTPQEQIDADVDAAYAYLAGLSEVDPSRVGAVGFCFGGTQVMHLGTRNPDLRAAVILYGSGPITDPQALGVMGQSGPVLGIYGTEDTSIPLDQVQGFEQALQKRDVEHTILVYPGVGHAFVTLEALEEDGPARDAWMEMVEFLRMALQPGS